MKPERLFAMMLFAAAAPATAGDYGSYAYDGETVALTEACVVVPHVDGIGYGKPDAIGLLASKPLDCDAYASWVSPASGAFADVVHAADGGLVELDVAPGPKLSRISVYGVGYTLGNDACEGCASKIEAGGAGLRGSVATGKPLMDGKIVLDTTFDLPKPAGPAKGEALAGGGDPGKAYLAYLKAYAEGDYEALKTLMPEGKAESDFGWYEEAERSEGIKSSGSMEPKSAKIVEAWKIGDGALLVTELPSPHGGDGRYRGYASLGFDGKGWRVRESRLDWGSPIK